VPEQAPRAEREPLLAIVAGQPTAEETAAVTAVLAALASPAAGPAASGGAPAGDGRRSAWADRERMLRPPVRPGPGAWRAWALPG
jgi:Acyl-CoA carboxylase epsilon subunit